MTALSMPLVLWIKPIILMLVLMIVLACPLCCDFACCTGPFHHTDSHCFSFHHDSSHSGKDLHSKKVATCSFLSAMFSDFDSSNSEHSQDKDVSTSDLDASGSGHPFANA